MQIQCNFLFVQCSLTYQILYFRLSNFYLVCFKEKIDLLWLPDCHHCGCHRSARTLIYPIKALLICIKGINTKLGILAHHDKIQLHDKGHNSKAIFLESSSLLLKFLSRIIALDRRVLVPHAVLLFYKQHLHII